MLLGQYEGRIEQKHRIAFPKKFRQFIGKELLITKGIDQHLLILSAHDSNTLLEGTEGKPFTDKSTREVQRYLFGNASSVSLDSQGRFLLPDYLRQYAKLEKEVMFVGVRSYIEVWDKKLWEAHQKNLSEHIVTITETLQGRNGNE